MSDRVIYPIYLSPSTQEHNIGNDDYGSEELRMNMIANVTMQELYRTNRFTIYHNRPDMTLDEVVRDSDSKNVDSHTAMHSNAQDSKHRGVLGLYWSKGGTTSASYKLAKAVHDEVLKVTRIDNGLRAGTGLAETDRVHATSTIVECGFHDNPEDAEFIETHIVELGIGYAKGICKHHGVTYIPKPISIPEPTPIILSAQKEEGADITQVKVTILGKTIEGYNIDDKVYVPIREYTDTIKGAIDEMSYVGGATPTVEVK